MQLNSGKYFYELILQEHNTEIGIMKCQIETVCKIFENVQIPPSVEWLMAPRKPTTVDQFYMRDLLSL